MSNQDNLNNANELGRTIALLIAQPYGLPIETTNTVGNLVKALADKAHQLLNPPAQKAGGLVDEILIATGDTAHIHGNGDVELVRSGTIVNMMASPDASPHASDCATNNRGVPELLPAGIYEFNSEALVRYLVREASEGKVDHVLHLTTCGGGDAQFYIRPQNASGQTVQFLAAGR